MRFFSTAILIFLLINCCTAQQFKEGFVQDKSGKYTYGFVGARVPGSPEGIEFKENRDGDAKTVLATEIMSYGYIDGKRFISYHNSTVDADWVFLDVAVDGELMLILRNGLFFLKRRDSDVFVHLNGIGNAYKKELAAAMNACPAAQSNAKRTKLTTTDLEKIFKEYNECATGETVSYEGLPPQFRVAVMAGGDVNPMSFKAKYPSTAGFLATKGMNDLSWFTGGLSFTLRHYPTTTRFGLNIGAFYNRARFVEANTINDNSKSIQQNEFTIEYDEVKIPVSIEFTSPTTSKFITNFRVGMVIPRVLDWNSTRKESTESEGEIYFGEGEFMTSLKKGIQAQAAFALDRKLFGNMLLRFEVSWSVGRVTADTNTLQNPTVSGTVHSFSFLGGFVF